MQGITNVLANTALLVPRISFPLLQMTFRLITKKQCKEMNAIRCGYTWLF